VGSVLSRRANATITDMMISKIVSNMKNGRWSVFGRPTRMQSTTVLPPTATHRRMACKIQKALLPIASSASGNALGAVSVQMTIAAITWTAIGTAATPIPEANIHRCFCLTDVSVPVTFAGNTRSFVPSAAK
jgi:3-deoxy-D-arabino-heptulosonate 7-phosphate (DAHP) synthase